MAKLEPLRDTPVATLFGGNAAAQLLAVPMFVNRHLPVSEHRVRIVENDLPLTPALLKGLLELAVGEDVLDVRSPKFARTVCVRPVGVRIEEICDPILSFRQVNRLRPMSPHHSVPGQTRNQAAGFDRGKYNVTRFGFGFEKLKAVPHAVVLTATEGRLVVDSLEVECQL